MAREKTSILNSITSIGSIIASIAAIFAIFQGNCQFNKSIDRTDKQIELILQEREIRNEENRPQITTGKGSINNFKEYVKSRIELENIGFRPAYGLTINNAVFSSNNFKVYNKISDTTFAPSNPLNKNQQVDFHCDFNLNSDSIYIIREKITYSDIPTGKVYVDTFYFTWINISDKRLKNNMLYGLDIAHKNNLERQFK